MRSLLTGALVLLGLALVLAGCGTSAREQRQRFLAKADGICAHFDTLQNEVQFPNTNPVARTTTHAARAEWAVSLKQVAYLGTQEVAELRKLKAPKPLRARFASLVAAKDAGFVALLAGADAAKRNRPDLLKARVAVGKSHLARATKLAKALGAKRCS